ncbi:MAG TPA: error-prone DNA polymerase [Burkholderiales bacterium]|jgi:error-prone DNA polymerase|nr:error-prone DNA polymerase [Burkholderiales bacterium]
MDYAELVCRSNFCFLKAASHPEDLVARAHALGYKALAITDEATVSGSVRAHLAAKSLGLTLIHGSQFELTDLPGRLTLLVKNREGWRELCRLISLSRQSSEKGQYCLRREQLKSLSLANTLALWSPQLFRSQALNNEGLLSAGQWLKSLWGAQLALGYVRHLKADDKHWLYQLEDLAGLLRLPLVAVGDVLMHRRKDKPLADMLTAIRLGEPIAQLGQRLAVNAEQYLRPRHRLTQLYPPALMQASLALAEQCLFSLDELRYEYPDEIVPAGLTPRQWLRHLTEDGIRRRYPESSYAQGLPAGVRQQIEHELELIHELNYEPYFLTVYDIVAFARSRGILCQGRGSAANSAVCYCLGITEVDPARMNMLFERFISKERNEPPDIDVDFEHHRREEVIQYIYGKYGRERAALAAALVRYRPRSALRDSGKALGIHSHLVDLAAKGRSWWDGKQICAEGLKESLTQGLTQSAGNKELQAATEGQLSIPSDTQLEQWAVLSSQLMGFPRHLSQHVGGFVIARYSLHDLVPTENASMAERSVIQWDKDDIDALGLLKVDVLALGMLSAIAHALVFVGQKQHPDKPLGARPMAMQNIPAEDPATYAMITAADTLGVFQIESRAQMSMLPRLKPQCFYDLVIEVAIVRPGPIQGGMVHPYLRRRQGLEPVDYPSPSVKQALERTLGVPIFQEQVMQLAILAAGFTAGEADQLRRAMAAWRHRGSLGPFQEKLVDGMLSRGYSRDFAERVFAQIQGFGEYGFPESHAASFALLVYVSCWLKCHHPDAFLAALLKAQPMGFYAPAQLVRDARAHGVVVHPVDVKTSQVFASLEPIDDQWAVRLGLHQVAHLTQEAMHRIVQARTAGKFRSVDDLAGRAELSRQDLQALAAAGALQSLGNDRHQAHWLATGHDRLPGVLQDAACEQELPAASLLPVPTEAQNLVADYASLGLSLGRHPLALLRKELKERFQSRPAIELQELGHQQLARASGLVTHRQRPGTAKGVVFITLEDETGSINLIIWPDVLKKYKQAVLHGQLLTAYGRWQRDQTIASDAPGQVTNLVALRIEDHTPLLAQRLGEMASSSRDFH